jgi:hypothetical protein
MLAFAWTLRVTVWLPTNVPALGLKRTARESDWAGGDDCRRDEHTSRTRSSARRVPLVGAVGIRAIQCSRGV